MTKKVTKKKKTKKKSKPVDQKKQDSNMSLDENQDISAQESIKELSERDIFTGNEDFYQLLSNFENATSPKSSQKIKSNPGLKSLKSFTFLQKILITAIFVIFIILVYVFLGQKTGKFSGPNPTSANPVKNGDSNSPALNSVERENIQEIPIKEVAIPNVQEETDSTPVQPASLTYARNFYRQNDFNNAFTVYKQLYDALPIGQEVMKNFLQLRMALCAMKQKDFEQASRLFAMVSESQSPIVRIIANYNLSLIEIERKRYLRARTRAYKALALVKAVDFDKDWALSFECDCYFLVAECLTRNILALSNSDSDLPPDLWTSDNEEIDPFINLREADLRQLLNSGKEHLDIGLLDPKLKRHEDLSVLPKWTVTSYGAPIEELLSKFATDADFNINWFIEEHTILDRGIDIIRKRPVSLYLNTATSQQIVLIAAGSAGLLAQKDENFSEYKVNIYNPDAYSSLQEHIQVLGRHAISLWQQYVLQFYSDNRLGNAHFAMGLIQSQIGLDSEAIAEYKLVANRFSQMSIAPYALLRSSKLKSELLDYYGAREDLKQLIEQYPETEIYGQAYLYFADFTKQAGLNSEAAQLYSRVFNFGLSLESKIASALGAGVCFYNIESYEDAEKWLIKYLELTHNSRSNDLYSAYFLLGKTYLALGNSIQAGNAFQRALTEQNSREQFVEAVAALVEGHLEQGNFVEALDALENIRSVALSQEQSVEMLLLRSRVNQKLGLADTAITALRDKAEYVIDPQLSAWISFELAHCFIIKEDLEFAAEYLTEVVRIAEPGPLAQDATVELADICLELDRYSQTKSLCSKLLDMELTKQNRQKTLKILADVYSKEKDYDKAALALSGQWE